MKLCVAINLGFLALIFFGCRENFIEPPAVGKNPEVKREVFDVKKYPDLTAVGKINFIGQRWCSTTLVSEDIAITAGHCFLESNFKFDLTKDFEPHYTSVIFRKNGEGIIKDINIKRVLTAKMNPDYAIVQLDKKIPEGDIKPLKFVDLTLEEMSSKVERLGCAGFNGDLEMGDAGWLMTISRNITLIPETSSKDRIDTNCVSTYGGSGGLFFEERYNGEIKSKEFYILGIVWGITDGKYNEKGEFIKDENVVTSITPVSAFNEELSKIISKNK